MALSKKELFDLRQLIDVTIEKVESAMGFLTLEAKLEIQDAILRAWDLGNDLRNDPHMKPTIPAPEPPPRDDT